MSAVLRATPLLEHVTADAEAYRFQVLLSRVVPSDDGVAELETVGFRADAEYFYPASTVKLLGAMAAMEFVGAGSAGCEGLTVDSPLVYHPLFDDEQVDDADESNLAGGGITLRHEIRKLFLVSDNRAYNRLYEFVGQEGLNRRVRAWGLTSARLTHRLSEFRSPEGNRKSPRITVNGAGDSCSLPERVSAWRFPRADEPGLLVGSKRATWSGGQKTVLEEPLNCRGLNRVSLADLHRVVVLVARPDVVVRAADGTPLAPPVLSGEHRELLLDAMAGYPGDSENPVYDREEYPDEYGKFFLPGIERVVPKARALIANKIGRAYGFSTDTAYIEDRETGEAFVLTAAVYANANDTLNDNIYEYESLADPLLADLGEAAARAVWGVPGSDNPSE